MGALPMGVARLVTRQGAVLAARGVAAGVIIFVLTSRFLRAVLVGVGRPDLLTVAAVSGTLMLIAIAASWIPARRASRIDPARALVGD
jgi:putative ABC transport system permease protein